MKYKIKVLFPILYKGIRYDVGNVLVVDTEFFHEKGYATLIEKVSDKPIPQPKKGRKKKTKVEFAVPKEIETK